MSWAKGAAMRPNSEGFSKRAKLSMMTIRAPSSRPQSTAKKTAPAPELITKSGRSRSMMPAVRKKLAMARPIILNGVPNFTWPQA